MQARTSDEALFEGILPESKFFLKNICIFKEAVSKTTYEKTLTDLIT